MVDLTTTNVWLGILAIVSLIEFLMICAAGFFGYRLYQKVMVTLDNVEREHLRPLHARADNILDEVQRITDKVRHAQDSVSDALKHVAGTGNAVAWAVKSRTWPILGVLQGLKSAASTVMKNGRKGTADSSYGAM
jgi:hypothetical protein